MSQKQNAHINSGIKRLLNFSKLHSFSNSRLKDNINFDKMKELNKKTRVDKEQLNLTINRLQVVYIYIYIYIFITKIFQVELETLKKNQLSTLESIKHDNANVMLKLEEMYKKKLVLEYEKVIFLILFDKKLRILFNSVHFVGK